MEYIWIFHGLRGTLASAVFSSKEIAENWINANQVQGILTKYPIDISVYDWTIEQGYFNPKSPEQLTPDYIQKFSSAYCEHYHYINEDEL
jgi:hypothetical protein